MTFSPSGARDADELRYYTRSARRLQGLGYHVQEDGETERILPAGITERFARGAAGELEPITQESTKAVAETRLQPASSR